MTKTLNAVEVFKKVSELVIEQSRAERACKPCELYAIKKNGRFVKDFSEGDEFTTLTNWSWVKKFSTKKAALAAAQIYGRTHGQGYSVVKL